MGRLTDLVNMVSLLQNITSNGFYVFLHCTLDFKLVQGEMVDIFDKPKYADSGDSIAASNVPCNQNSQEAERRSQFEVK